LVNGIIATKATIAILRVAGYPEVSTIFEVISSITPSPNINMPVTARVMSRMN